MSSQACVHWAFGYGNATDPGTGEFNLCRNPSPLTIRCQFYLITSFFACCEACSLTIDHCRGWRHLGPLVDGSFMV